MDEKLWKLKGNIDLFSVGLLVLGTVIFVLAWLLSWVASACRILTEDQSGKMLVYAAFFVAPPILVCFILSFLYGIALVIITRRWWILLPFYLGGLYLSCLWMWRMWSFE